MARRRRTRRSARPVVPPSAAKIESGGGGRNPRAAGRIISPHSVFLVLGLILGVTCILLTPPFQVPDEPQHFYRAYQVSELRPLALVALNNGQREGTLLPTSLATFVDASGVAAIRFRPANKVDPTKLAAARAIALSPHDRGYLPVAPYPPVGYLPQAIGIALGRLIRASPLILFYLARLSGLAAWLILVVLAIKITPLLKWTYVVLALMPMTLYLAASTSVDGVVIGASFLLSALMLSWAYDDTKEKITGVETVSLGSLGVVVALSKALYLPLLLLFFLVPWKKFGSRTRYVLTIGAVIAGSAAVYVGWNLLSAWMTTPGPSIDLARHGVDASHLPDVSSARQLEFIRTHPGAFIRALVTTVSVPGILFYYLNSFVGMFGWLDTMLPTWLPYAYLAVLMIVSLLSGSTTSVSWRAKALSTGVFVLTGLAVLVVLYVGYSSVGMIVVGGFQGRYLIPVAPLLFLAFHWPQSRWQVTNAVAVGLVTFLVITAAIAGDRLVNRFYVAELPSYAIEAAAVSSAGDVITVRGWAVDRATFAPAESVELEIDGQDYRARYGIERNDVVQRVGKPSYRFSGFEVQIPMADVGRGRHTLALRVWTKGSSYVVPDPKAMLDLK